jgi:DNA topoisomerase VI subunit A
MKKEQILKKITKLADELEEEVESGKNPSIVMSAKGLSNVEFDEKNLLLTMGEKTMKRSFLNIAHARKFMQTVMVANLCRRLVEADKHASIRELYYQLKHTIEKSKENTFEGQEESDPIIEDLERTLDVLREQMNLNADRRGYLYGNLKIVDSGDTINCAKLGRGGYGIPSTVEDLKFAEVNADFALVIETAAMYERLVEEQFAKKQNAILIATQGQAARGVRRLIHRLNAEANLPVIVFTDGDPYGYYIYSVIKMGSINLAYLSSDLGTPQCKFVGMTMTDIEKYSHEKVTERLKDLDIKRLKEEMDYAWFKNRLWQNELKKMLKGGVRIEQQALANKSLEFVAKKYLPDKIARSEFLP